MGKNASVKVVTKATGKQGGTNKPATAVTKPGNANKNLNARAVVKPSKKK